MKKLSNINESAWGEMRKRSSGQIIRQEDAFNPDYVDFGENTTVYWAIDNLEINGEVKFYFDNVKDYNNNGWRLPTVDEVNQLKWNIRIAWYEGCKHLQFDDGNELKLKTNGSGGFHMWTKEINTKFPTGAYAYGFDNSYKFDIDSFNKSINRLFVFLVKDKHHINESAWGEMRHRSSGQIIRKEDDTTNIREIKPVDLGLSVLWADRDLELKQCDANYMGWDGKYYFEYDAAEDIIKGTKWRIPTKEEMKELIQYTEKLKNTDEVYEFKGDFDDGLEMVFNKRGYLLGGSDFLHSTNGYFNWTSTKIDNEIYYMSSIKEKQEFISMHYKNRLCVRLVQDK